MQHARGSFLVSARPDAARPLTAAPLSGRTVVVTRARHQADALGDLLEARGARVFFFPMIRIVPPEDRGPLNRAVARHIANPVYDWIIFTSANAVQPFVEAIESSSADPLGHPRIDLRPALRPARILAVGPATADALARSGLRPDLVPDDFVGEGVLEALERELVLEGEWEGSGLGRVLLPRAAHARPLLPEALRARGASVDIVEAYRTVPENRGARELRRLLAAGEVDIVTFTSSSTVRNFHARVLEREPAVPGGAALAAIGPVTAKTARELGLPVAIVADPYTAPALVDACVAYLSV